MWIVITLNAGVNVVADVLQSGRLWWKGMIDKSNVYLEEGKILCSDEEIIR